MRVECIEANSATQKWTGKLRKFGIRNSKFEIMEDYRDYRCPKECSGRSKDCHIACERHEKYRELNAKRLKAEHDEQLTITEAFRKKLNKTTKTRYTKTVGD